MTFLIEEDDVNMAKLSLILEQAVIEHTVEHNDRLYVRERGWFPFWISLDEFSRRIKMNTYIQFRGRSSEIERLRVANTVALNVGSVSVCVTDARLRFDLDLSYKDGLLQPHFVRAVRNFSHSIQYAKNSADSNWISLLPLGEDDTEPSPEAD